MIGLALLAVMSLQDSSASLSPRVRSMLGDFPPPRPGEPSIAIRFSSDSAWVGEQVELVTATWFPRALRDRLRHEPTIRAPSLSGLWSARSQLFPVPVLTRYVGNQVYDLYVAYQTIFPLAPGLIDAPPAVLAFSVPTSSSYFAPEDRKTFTSRPARLSVRAVPASVASGLGNGPTARNLQLVWRGPAGALTAGAPAIVELAVSGEGNLTLWPAPQIAWPAAAHVYPEPTIEHVVPLQGLIAGEKRFRFTIVIDSGGVLALPAVSYPYFDPGIRSLRMAAARSLELPILVRGPGERRQELIPVLSGTGAPLATILVRSWWPVLLILTLAPVGIIVTARRRPAVRAPLAQIANPEAALRAALGTPVAAGPDHVVNALRRRGIARDDAEHVRRWLSATVRRRYGADHGTEPDAPPAVHRVLDRLRLVAVLAALLAAAHPLRAGEADAVARYRGGDYAGAAREFAAAVDRTPDGAVLWRNLGAARWMTGDDVGAAAAWLSALSLAPRDQDLRLAWRAANAPADVRAMAPRIPLSRDELIVGAVMLWLAAWIVAFAHRLLAARILGVVCFAAAALALARWQGIRPGTALMVADAAPHISPNAATMAFETLPPWTAVHIERHLGGWVLISTDVTVDGSLVAKSVTGWVRATSVAAIGPLD